MRLRAGVSEPDWSTIRYLAMDEFALHKGHRYGTVVVDPISRQVLWIDRDARARRPRPSSNSVPKALPSVSSRSAPCSPVIRDEPRKSPTSPKTCGALSPLLAETEGFEPSIQVLAQMLP